MKRVVCTVLLLCLLLAAGCAAKSEQAEPANAYARLADLAGKRIGVSTGAIFDQAALAQWPDAKLLYYETLSDQIIALQ